jgi:pantetheine-phosphate adenylyltransferase
MTKAIYPGTFDPITYGHIDVVERALRIFGRLTVAVIENPSKDALFSFSERKELARKTLTKFKNKIEIEGFDGLMVHYAQKKKAAVIVRGLRMLSDFEYEFQMALTNRKLTSTIETVFLMPSPEYSYVSSRLIKEAFFLGADVSFFVPRAVEEAFRKRKI